MRLHEQLGGPEPDGEVETLRASWRREKEEGADDPLVCPDCGELTGDGGLCGECLSERASYYIPEGGGQG